MQTFVAWVSQALVPQEFLCALPDVHRVNGDCVFVECGSDRFPEHLRELFVSFFKLGCELRHTLLGCGFCCPLDILGEVCGLFPCHFHGVVGIGMRVILVKVECDQRMGEALVVDECPIHLNVSASLDSVVALDTEC